MMLAELISKADPTVVTSAAQASLADVQSLGYEGICSELDSNLRTLAYVQPIVLARLPPAFSVISVLLEQESLKLGLVDLKERCRQHVSSIVDRIEVDGLLQSSDQKLYRRVLHAAWLSGMTLDASELSVLGVLRNELGLNFVDHFLACYHSEFRPLWDTDDAFERELSNLVNALLVFRVDGDIVIAREMRHTLGVAIGVPLTDSVRRRLFEWISTRDLVEALRLNDLPAGGAKAERVERLVRRMVPAQMVLQTASISDLQGIAEQTGCVKYGSKDQLIARLSDHFAEGRDQSTPEAAAPPTIVEAKLLAKPQFVCLFESFSGKELESILDSTENLPRSGSKALRVSNLWGSTYSEVTLLSSLQNRQLEDALARLDLRTGGTKTDRVNRLVDHALTLTLTQEEGGEEIGEAERTPIPEFTRGKAYTRKEILSLLGISDSNGGAWYTGYARHGSDWFIFANVDTAGRTGHDYANKLSGGKLEWYGREESKLSNASIQSMLTPTANVYIFMRSDDRDPFRFFGIGKAESVEDVSPVRIVWKLN
jgi:hypothetical protein